MRQHFVVIFFFFDLSTFFSMRELITWGSLFAVDPMINKNIEHLKPMLMSLMGLTRQHHYSRPGSHFPLSSAMWFIRPFCSSDHVWSSSLRQYPAHRWLCMLLEWKEFFSCSGFGWCLSFFNWFLCRQCFNVSLVSNAKHSLFLPWVNYDTKKSALNIIGLGQAIACETAMITSTPSDPKESLPTTLISHAVPSNEVLVTW